MLKAFGDFTPEGIAEMKTKLQALDDKKLLDEKGVEELLLVRTERMRAETEEQIKLLSDRATKSEEKEASTFGKITKLIVDADIQAAVMEVGVVKKGAMTHVLQRGRETWQLDENELPVPMKNGKTVFGVEGKPLTMKEWAVGMLKTDHFLFEGSGGGGAGGGDGHTGPTISMDAAQEKAVANGGSGDFVSQLAKGEVRVQ